MNKMYESLSVTEKWTTCNVIPNLFTASQKYQKCILHVWNM